ncbi:MAG: VCBS repeat-containing protein [Bacteroidetes bacterium]|nr:VCBS repeat-containing protein [Bacteroidota bacterium]
MKLINNIVNAIITLLTIISPFFGFAQAPFIKSISKNSARAQETLTLQGINFGTNAANVKVMFGSVAVTPQTISDQLIEVNVPVGTAYENISVINTSTGMSGFSQNPFLLSYGGTNPFDATKMAGQFDFDSESELYDLTLADFDGDGKSDVATANKSSANIDAFRNTSAPGSVSFSKTVLSTGFSTTTSLHVSSGDLNGDGKPEILVTENNGSRIVIFKNTSSGSMSFSAPQYITVAGAKTAQVRVIDIDLNGKPDLVITDQSTSRIFVALNQSTLSTITFAAATAFTLGGTKGVDGISVSDLDGNGLPEIVACEFNTLPGKIFILKNLSAPGALSFEKPLEFTAPTTVSNLKIGDLDGDSKPDIAATALLGAGVLIFQNQSTASAVQFTALPLIDANFQPWGIDFGDLDGDGKADIVVASIGQKAVTILNNQSTPGNFVFQKQTKTTTYINRHVRIGDLDGDGRPDVNFTSIDDKSGSTPILASKISVFTNLNCIVPVLTPVGPLNICSGFTQRVNASSNPGATYEWFKDAVSMGAPGANSFLDVTATGSYTVRLVIGSCSNTSATGVSVTVNAAAPKGPVTPSAGSPVCIGGTLSLSVNNVGADDYVWTGPGLTTPAHATSSANAVTVPNFQLGQAGKYTVEVIVGTSPGCVTQRADVVVDAVAVPGLQAIFSGSDILCAGQNKVISFVPSVTGYTYQWADQTSGDIVGATNTTYTATTSGIYLVKLKSIATPTCPAVSSTTATVTIAAIPIVDFNAPTTACKDLPVNFSDQSTLDSNATTLPVSYQWDFGDTNSGTGSAVSHTFATASSFNVKLTVSYRSQSCPVFKTKSVSVQAPPTASITSASSAFCPGDSLLLQVLGSFDSYLWNNGKNTPSIYVKQDGSFTVDVTKGPCKVTTAPKSVSFFTLVPPVAAADPTRVDAGDSTKLSVTGLSSAFLWRPNKKILSDSLIANPRAAPIETTTFTVSGKDANGCRGEATVEVTVSQKNPLSSLRPHEIISPDRVDGQNDFWIVENAPNQPGCSVAIYDERGLKIYQAKPYMNDWSGISSGGKVLPAGVYYYIIKCDDSPKNHLAGSINIVR